MALPVFREMNDGYASADTGSSATGFQFASRRYFSRHPHYRFGGLPSASVPGALSAPVFLSGSPHARFFECLARMHLAPPLAAGTALAGAGSFVFLRARKGFLLPPGHRARRSAGFYLPAGLCSRGGVFLPPPRPSRSFDRSSSVSSSSFRRRLRPP